MTPLSLFQPFLLLRVLPFLAFCSHFGGPFHLFEAIGYGELTPREKSGRDIKKREQSGLATVITSGVNALGHLCSKAFDEDTQLCRKESFHCFHLIEFRYLIEIAEYPVGNSPSVKRPDFLLFGK